MIQYDTSSPKGDWICNADEKDLKKLNLKTVQIGPPRATRKYTEQQLRHELKLVGVYTTCTTTSD